MYFQKLVKPCHIVGLNNFEMVVYSLHFKCFETNFGLIHFLDDKLNDFLPFLAICEMADIDCFRDGNPLNIANVLELPHLAYI